MSNELMIEILTDALHLAYDQNQISHEDYLSAISFVLSDFQPCYEKGWNDALRWVSLPVAVPLGATQSPAECQTGKE